MERTGRDRLYRIIAAQQREEAGGDGGWEYRHCGGQMFKGWCEGSGSGRLLRTIG